MQQYHIFGSEDSIDLDIVFFVDELGTINENFRRSKALSADLSPDVAQGKKINANLAVISDGVIAQVYKGTADELNNSLRRTYAFHKQEHELLITRDLKRDLDLKLLRTVRKTVSFFSRTELRPEIKFALRNGFLPQVEVLKAHDLTALEIDPSKAADVWKVILFSVAQIMALEEGVELYTKHEIAETYPELSGVMYREPGDHRVLCQRYLGQLLRIAESCIERGMTSYFEYDYE